MQNKTTVKKSLFQKFDPTKILNTALIMFVGLLVGAIILLIGGFSPVAVYTKMFTGVFGSWKSVAYTVVKSAPIIGTGLSIAFANRSGLFNIGAEGQFIAGTVAATVVGYLWILPAGVHPVVLILFAALAGGLVGALSGVLKTKLGINEVISGIMLNWVLLYARNAVVEIPIMKKSSDLTHFIKPTAEIGIFSGWWKTPSGVETLNANPILKDISKTGLNWGIFIVIAIAIFIWFLLNKTTVGYKIKAVGLNPHAAEYAGISIAKNCILAMFIAGAIAGVAGGMHVAGVSRNMSVLNSPEGYGFDGIAVALIGGSSPLGCVLSGFLMGALKYGGTKIQAAPIKAPMETINIMIGTIMLFAALPNLIKIKNKFIKTPAAKAQTPEIEQQHNNEKGEQK